MDNDDLDSFLRAIIETVEEEDVLSPLMRVVYFNLIDDCLDKLDIVKASYAKLTREDDEPVSVKYSPPDERFGFSATVQLHENLKLRVGDDPTDFTRLQKIVALMMHALNVGGAQIIHTGSLKNLQAAMNNLERMRQDELDILTTNIELNRTFAELSEQLALDKKNLTKEINDCDVMLKRREFELGVTFGNNSLILSHVEYWENSRIEQNQQTLDDVTNGLRHTISDVTDKIVHENFAHGETEKFVEEFIQDLYADIERWSMKYESDLEAKDLEIVVAKTMVEGLIEEIDATRAQYEAHQAEIDNFLASKLAQRGAEEQLELETRAAMKIQAWWRGVLKQRNVKSKKKKKKGKGKKGRGKKVKKGKIGKKDKKGKKK